MLGVLALLVCLGAAIAAGRILYFLYAPQVTAETLARLPGHVVIEPLFAARPRPAAPRTRLARGTGAVVQAAVPRDERTEKVSALPMP